jgi:hypothetical protein
MQKPAQTRTLLLPQRQHRHNRRICNDLYAVLITLLCCAALDLPGVAECRGYVQHWWGEGNPIPERSAQRILKGADQILKAGTAESATTFPARTSKGGQ